jgi:hypothetical protein
LVHVPAAADALAQSRLQIGRPPMLSQQIAECFLRQALKIDLAVAKPKLPQLKSSKLLIRLADWKIVAVRYWLHFDGDIEE